MLGRSQCRRGTLSEKGVGSDLTVCMGESPCQHCMYHTGCHIFTNAGKSHCENLIHTKWSFCTAIQKSLIFMSLKVNVSVKLYLILKCDRIVAQQTNQPALTRGLWLRTVPSGWALYTSSIAERPFSSLGSNCLFIWTWNAVWGSGYPFWKCRISRKGVWMDEKTLLQCRTVPAWSDTN